MSINDGIDERLSLPVLLHLHVESRQPGKQLLAGGALCSVLVSAVAMQVGYGELAVYSSRLALLFALGMVLYILPRLAQSVRLEALRSEISFRLSTGGWIFLALLLLVSLLARHGK